MRYELYQRLLTLACIGAVCGIGSWAWAVDFESFEFNDANGTQLGAVANTANPGNAWVADPDMGGSQTQQALGGRPGSYYVIKASDTTDNNFLQINDITSGTRYLSAKISGWNFLEATDERFRLGFVTGDTAPAFNDFITAQMSLVHLSTGEVELTGGALGTLGTGITSNVTFAAERTTPFEMTLAIDKTANTYEVFYRDGNGPSQSLGMGLIDPSRDARTIRMQAVGIFGDFAQFFPVDYLDYLAVDRIALTDVNPHTDLITLEIDRDNGAMTLRNTSGAAVNGIESYSIVSGSGGLNPAGWQPVAGGTTSGTTGELMQTLGSPINLATNATLGLNNVSGAWLKSPFEDVSMVLNLAGGVTRTVNVNFIDNGGLRFDVGDLNFDNAITAADYTLLVASAETDLTGLSDVQAYRAGDLSGDGLNSIQDFIQFKTIYEAENGGAGSFARMIAGVPEPSTVFMALVGAAVLIVRGRSRHTCINRESGCHAISSNDQLTLLGESVMSRATSVASFALLAVLATFAAPASADILEDFTFSDGGGTLADAANSVNALNKWTVDANLNASNISNGVFRIQKGNQALSSNYLDIANITTGKAWLVAEMSGWSLSSVVGTDDYNSAEPEEVRFAFLNNDTSPPSGSTITGQAVFIRNATGGFDLRGIGPAGGANDLQNVLSLDLARNIPFHVAVEIDTDTDLYSVYYKDGNSAYQLLGTTSYVAGRNGNSLRFAINNSFAGSGEFFDISRIYVTDDSPFDGPIVPITLTLEVRSNGQIFIKNETANPVSFDSYRIASGSASLNEAGWASLQSAGVDSIGAGAGQHWTVSGGSSDSALAESFLLGASTLEMNEEFSLGSAFKIGGMQDLTFQYRDIVSGSLVSVVPTYVTVAGVDGDYNNNGIVDAADYTIWRDHLNSSFQLENEGGISPGTVDAADYNFWKLRFGATSGAGSASVSAVPEPASMVLLAGMAAWGLAIGRRRCGA